MNSDKPTSQSLESVLQSLYESLGIRRILAGFFAGAGISLLLMWALIMLESFLWLGTSARTFMLSLALGFGLVAALLLYIKVPRTNYTDLYRDFSQASNLPQIRYILDLSYIPKEEQAGLHQAAVDQQLDQLDENSINSNIKAYRNEHPANTSLQLSTFLLIIGLALFAGFAAIERDAFTRIMSPGDEFLRPNPFQFAIIPGNNTLEQGTIERIQINFQYGSTVPENVQLSFRTARETQFRTQRMASTNEGEFASSPLELFDDIEYYVSMDGYQSERFVLRVQLLPRFTDLTVQVTPPSYTALESTRYQYPFSRIEAYPGSEIAVTGNVNQPLTSIELFSSLLEEPIRLIGSDGTYSATLTSSSDPDSLWFAMQEHSGLENRNSFSFEVQPLTDEYPEVRILRPEPTLAELDPRSLNMVYELRDDFGFNRIELGYAVYRSNRPNDPERGSIRLNRPSERIAVEDYNWNLTELRLLPFDQVVYWIDAYDNDSYSGFKHTRSAEHRLTVRSLTDYLLAQEEREDDIADRLREFQEAYDQNRRDFEDVRQRILQNEGDNWDQSQEAEQVRESREDLARQLDQIKEEFDQLRNDLSEENQLSPQTKQLYEDLQRLMEEIDDPEILEAMKRLQEGLENMDMNQVRDALQQIEFDEERYQQRLERTMELFKNLQMNAELDRMNAMLEDMARQEDSLIGDDLPDEQEQQRLQEQIRDDLNQLQQRLETMPERSSRRNMQEMTRLNEQLQQEMSAVDEQLGDDISDLQEGGDGDSDSAQQRRQEIRDQLNTMRQQVRQSQSSMNQQSIQINRQALLGIMQNLLLLSDAQESLVQRTGELTQGSAGFVPIAREQLVVSRTFAAVTDSLFRVSAEVPQFPNLINDRKAVVQRHLERAIQLLAERDRNRSVAEERIALGGINEIASLLADLLDQLDDSGGDGDGGGGMSAEQLADQLQKLSGEQAELNQMIQDMINDMAGERLMQDQMDRLDQMARQQNEIRRQLRQIQQGGGLSSGDDLMSQLQRLAEEMEDAINDLRGGYIEERVVVQRQQNILSRMLEAERALNEREEDEERRGDRAEDVDRVSPSELTLQALREQIRRRLQSSDETRFTDEYQQLIQRYFEILEAEEQRRGAINR